MALFHVNFRAQTLNHNTEITVMIPEGLDQEHIPVLWLLHGMHGNHDDWHRKTVIERYSNDYGIAVVCPDGENSYYTNMAYGKRYFDYVSDELVRFVRKTFRFSDRREDNFICGLSMGGYGALHTALMCPEQYAAAASLSGVVDLVAILDRAYWPREATCVWGEKYAENVANTDADLMYRVANFPADAPKPRIFTTCGTEDGLYRDNLTFRDFMQKTDFDYTYAEGPGIHNWVFWNEWVEKAIIWMLNK
ncbi:MAG: alpha/beta hydrolase [Eubacteriales bacterium]